MGSRGITKLELLLAIAMSEYYQVTLVHYIPPKTNYTSMLKALRHGGYVKATNSLERHFTLTQLGKNYLIRKDADRFADLDKEINDFVDQLK